MSKGPATHSFEIDLEKFDRYIPTLMITHSCVIHVHPHRIKFVDIDIESKCGRALRF